MYMYITTSIESVQRPECACTSSPAVDKFLAAVAPFHQPTDTERAAETAAGFGHLRSMLDESAAAKERKAAELEEEDGRKIGESLARSLAVNTQATAAVDAWIGNFPALKELDEEFEWFRPMIETIGYRLLEEVPWGLKARVTVGAVTSMSDLLTDV